MKYYIAPDFEAQNGIAHYAKNFFELILKEKKYKHRALSSVGEINELIENILDSDVFHVEIGLGTIIEREFLFKLLNSKDVVVDITLHDPPHIKYPYYEYKNQFLNNVSKFMQHYLNYFGFGRKYYKRIRTIYVLNKKGTAELKRIYNGNSKYMPHILPNNSLIVDKKFSRKRQLLYVGFIGKKKGLEYVLQLHQALINSGILIKLKIIGKPVDRVTLAYFENLKKKYSNQTMFLGYVSNEELKINLEDNNIVILPTIDYKYICPTSGSVLNALLYANTIMTTKANAISEIIQEGYNGFYLTGVMSKDLEMLKALIADSDLLLKISKNCIEYINGNHAQEIVRQYYLSTEMRCRNENTLR